MTYEGFAAAWPTMTDEAGFSDRMNNLPKYVVSTTLNNLEWNNPRLIRGNVVEELADLKRQPGQDILLSGSADLVNSLVPHDVIDEYRFMLHPIVAGRGKRLFRDGIDTPVLRLVSTQSFSTGIVILTCQRASAES